MRAIPRLARRLRAVIHSMAAPRDRGVVLDIIEYDPEGQIIRRENDTLIYGGRVTLTNQTGNKIAITIYDSDGRSEREAEV